MGIIQLKEEQSSALAQLHDSLVDSLNKRNELDKEIKKQIEEYDKIVSELKVFNEEYDRLNEKMKDSVNLTSIDAQKARDIVFQINYKKEQKQKLEPMDKDLYERYLAINEEIDNIKERIDSIINSKQEIDVKEGIYIESLNSNINIINTNVDGIYKQISNRSIISKSDISTTQIIERTFRKNGMDIEEDDSIHSKLAVLFNNRNAQSYEESALLDNLQYYKDKKDDTNIELNNQDNNLESSILEVNTNKIESSNLIEDINTSNSNDKVELTNITGDINTPNNNDKIELPNLDRNINTLNNNDNMDINSSMYKLDSIPSEDNNPSYIVTITSAMNPVKIANSTQAKKTSILNNFNKRRTENTIIKTDIKQKEVNNVIDINQFLSMNKAA